MSIFSSKKKPPKHRSRGLSIAETVSGSAERLRESARNIQRMQREQDSALSVDSCDTQSESDIFRNAAADIEAAQKRGIAGLEKAAKTRIEAEQEYRRFQLNNAITRPVRRPDIVITCAILLICLLIEGGMAGALFIADGHMDIVQGFVSGFVLAGVNIIAGHVIGFFPGRYLGFRIHSTQARPFDGFIRFAAFTGIIASAAAVLLLHFGAARVRVTGDFHGIFNFDTVSFAATFNDYYALALILLGIVTACVSVFKGRHGIADPIPGYTAVANDCDQVICESAGELYDDSIDDIEDCYEDALERLEDIRASVKQTQHDNRAQRLDLHEAIAAHNDEVQSAIDTVRDMRNSYRAAQHFIAQKDVVSDPDDAAVFTPLFIDHTERPVAESLNQDEDSAQAEARLHSVYREAISALRDAYSAFSLAATAMTFSFSEELNNHNEEPSHV